VIRAAGIKCNDMMSAAVRPRLAPLAADAAGTGLEPSGVAGQVLTVRLLAWVAQRVSQHWSHRRLCQNAVNAALNWADCPCSKHQAVADRTYQAMRELPYYLQASAIAARTASADPIRCRPRTGRWPPRFPLTWHMQSTETKPCTTSCES